MSKPEGSPAPELGHLFRRESGRLVSALTRVFGVHNLELAEDVVQDALCRALELWKLRGFPDDPAAWLLVSARNRAVDVLRRERRTRVFAPELTQLIQSEWTLVPALSEMFQDEMIRDDQLRMMFSCCHPKLSDSASVALMLSLLCGFSVQEVAAAFLAEPASIEKRIVRAKGRIAASGRLYELRGTSDLKARLARVLRALYLLFNEGYHGSHSIRTVREELCEEAIRLCTMLAEHPSTNSPEVLALLALMYLNAARLPGRINQTGELMPLNEQDRGSWNSEFVQRGINLLNASASGDFVTPFHVEAAIAAEHATSPSLAGTNWTRIVEHYDILLKLRPTPVVALNRAIAIGQEQGPERGLAELAELGQDAHLARYPFFEAAFGELELRAGRAAVAQSHFERAAARARGMDERRFFLGRAAVCAGEQV